MAALPRPCLVESILFTSRPQTTFFSAPRAGPGGGPRGPPPTRHGARFELPVPRRQPRACTFEQGAARCKEFGLWPRVASRCTSRPRRVGFFTLARRSRRARLASRSCLISLTLNRIMFIFYRTFLLYAHETNVRSSQYSEAWFEAREFTSSRAHLYMSCKAARTWRPGCVARRAERRQHARPEAEGRRAGGRGGQKCSTRAQIPGAAPGSVPVQLVLGLLLGLRARPVQQRDHHQEGCELQEVGAVLDGRNRAKTATP